MTQMPQMIRMTQMVVMIRNGFGDFGECILLQLSQHNPRENQTDCYKCTATKALSPSFFAFKGELLTSFDR